MPAPPPVEAGTALPPLTCAVLDDELLPRLTAAHAVQQHAGLQLLGQFASVADLAAALPTPPAVLFLDIELGAENGMAYFKSLAAPPLTVFITSHPEFALEGIEAAAFDYILKPLTPARFAKVAARLLEHQALRHKAALYELHIGPEFLNIREGYDVSRVALPDIVYLEALDNYTKIHTPGRCYLTLMPLKTLCEQLPARHFLRIHRTFAVAVNRINSLKGAELLVGGTALPVGKTYRQAVGAFLRSDA